MPQAQHSGRPWGDLFVEVPIQAGPLPDGTRVIDSAWVPIATVFEGDETRPQTFVFELHSEPLCWADKTCPRRLMIAKRKHAEVPT